jgi:phosphoglycolate phosphatase-like HAD superfamily hydrolase
MKRLEDYTTIIFDLDDTLYNEIEYLSRAYRFISNKISELNNHFSPKDIFNFLLEEFKSNGRKNLYQKLITKFDGLNYPLSDFLNDLRTVPIPENSIQIKDELYSFIQSNINNYKFFIATNGNKIQQENKFRSADIPFKNNFNIVYCDALGVGKRKPSPFFINYISENFHIKLDEMIFIGDSDVDYSAALNGKIDFLTVENFIKKNR